MLARLAPNWVIWVLNYGAVSTGLIGGEKYLAFSAPIFTVKLSGGIVADFENRMTMQCACHFNTLLMEVVTLIN